MIKSNNYLTDHLMTLIICILCKDGVVLEGNRRVIRGTK